MQPHNIQHSTTYQPPNVIIIKLLFSPLCIIYSVDGLIKDHLLLGWIRLDQSNAVWNHDKCPLENFIFQLKCLIVHVCGIYVTYWFTIFKSAIYASFAGNVMLLYPLAEISNKLVGSCRERSIFWPKLQNRSMNTYYMPFIMHI